MLTFCEKIIAIEAHGRHRFLRSFREEAHVAVPGSEADASVRIFVQECLAAFGYLDGPFQLDLIRRGKRLFFLETGFRLSGTNLLDLVRRVTGIDWAEESMSIHLADDRRDAVMSRPPRYGGQITLRRSGQLEQAESLRAEAREADADLLIQRFSPPALPPEWQHRLPRSLDADLSRHAGALGRVIVTASSHSTVLSLLERLSRPVVMA
jgi:hypothetical protein